jgi:ADP-heptose:LPS heptosyltransferase
VISLHESVSNFEDSAAIAKQLHAVVTVDTSVAHLCGGLGVPTWVLVPHRADWRWMFEREDSPWYPSVHLLRRPQADDGRYVLEHAREALARELLVSDASADQGMHS